MKSPAVTICLVVVVLACSTGPVHGWWCQGHMLTALIAQRTMNPEVLKKSGPLITYLAKDYPQSPDFVQSACWADDLKSLGVEEMSNWHFINLPYVKNALFAQPPGVRNSSNVAWGIQSSNYTVWTSRSKTLDKARFLRFMIHFAGDIHQPLHAATMFDQSLFPPPVGDEGGNKYKIQGANQSVLHQFFDSGAGQWQSTLNRPLNTSSESYLEGWADTIMKAYPMSAFKDRLMLASPYQWAEGTFKLAVNFAYTTPFDGKLTDAYIAEARQVCQSQVALGGYRLASLMNTLFA